MRKIQKDFARKLEFKDIRFPVKIRDIHKIEKENYISINVFGYENRAKFSIYVSKNTFKKKSQFIIERRKMPIYKQTLHRNRKNCCLYCLQYFHTAEILERHIMIVSKLIADRQLKWLRKVKFEI